MTVRRLARLLRRLALWVERPDRWRDVYASGGLVFTSDPDTGIYRGHYGFPPEEVPQ